MPKYPLSIVFCGYSGLIGGITGTFYYSYENSKNEKTIFNKFKQGTTGAMVGLVKRTFFGIFGAATLPITIPVVTINKLIENLEKNKKY